MSRRKFTWAAAPLLLSFMAAVQPLWAQDLNATDRQRLFYTVKPAVAFVLVMAQAQIELQTDEDTLQMQSQSGNTGSAWIISPDGYLVTNGHVVELFHARNEDRLKMMLFYQALEENYFPAVAKRIHHELAFEQKLALFQKLYPQAEITLKKDLYVFLQNWKRYPGEVKEYSAPMFPVPGKVSFPGQDIETGKDVAIVKIEGRDLPTVRLGDSDAAQIGDEIYVAGYPGVVFSHEYLSQETALEASFTRGQISSVKLDVKGTNVIQMDAATTWGNSGGPVFSSQGEVIGMATFGSISQTTGTAQAIQGFNFAVPANTAREFIRAAGVSNIPGLFDQAWARSLDDFYGGRYSKAIADFDEVLRIMPDLPDAIKLRHEAIAAVQAQPTGPGVWLRYILGAVVLLGILALVSGLLLRRRGTGSLLPASTNGRKSGRLVVTEGPLRGNQFPVTTVGIRIGRDSDSCQVVLTESTVSREHALIVADGGTIRIRNLSGTNPTYVNDRAIQETELKEGDHIKIGTSIITFERA
jgi:serine protease Do